MPQSERFRVRDPEGRPVRTSGLEHTRDSPSLGFVRAGVLIAVCVVLAAVLLLSGFAPKLSPKSGTGSTAPPSTSSTARPTTSIAPPPVTAPPPITAPPSTSTTSPPVTVAGGLVIQPSYQVVDARGPVHALASPAGPPLQTYPRLNELGAVTTLLAVQSAGSWGAQGWFEVRIPRRPNGSTAWVSGDEVTARVVTTAVVVELSAHRLTLYDQGLKVSDYPVAVGATANPTPTGTFWITGVLQGYPSSAYGSYALGTSAFSDTLTEWPGGGVVGIHGTNNPGSIGKSVSHGCIRMYNNDVTQLAQAVSLGTPVLILP